MRPGVPLMNADFVYRVCGKKFFVGAGCGVWGVGCGVLPILRWSEKVPEFSPRPLQEMALFDFKKA